MYSTLKTTAALTRSGRPDNMEDKEQNEETDAVASYSRGEEAETQKVQTDWSLCLFCQTVTSKKLICPANSKRKDLGAGYRSLQENLKSFRELTDITTSLNTERLDEGDGFFTTFEKQKAKWHKTCRDNFNSTKISRLKKKRCSTENDGASASFPISPKKCRPSYLRQQESPRMSKASYCFFCEEPGKPGAELHKASTSAVDSRVLSAALILGDTNLLAKLTSGAVIAIGIKYHAKCLVSLYNRVRGKE